MNLRKGIKKQDYRNETEWLEAIYEKNRELIDSKVMPVEGTSKQAFIQLVKEYREEGYTPLKAVDALERSTLFTDIQDRFISNAYTAIKEDREAWQTFRNLSKNAKGQYTKVDFSKFSYDNGQYIYQGAMGKIIIDFTNSPYSVIVKRA